jgi:ABC-type lipoprotein release transport system permease subunit
VGAAILTRFIHALLFNVGAMDPLTFAAVPLVFVGIGLIASWVPAHRATRVDPARALRAE